MTASLIAAAPEVPVAEAEAAEPVVESLEPEPVAVAEAAVEAAPVAAAVADADNELKYSVALSLSQTSER